MKLSKKFAKKSEVAAPFTIEDRIEFLANSTKKSEKSDYGTCEK